MSNRSGSQVVAVDRLFDALNCECDTRPSLQAAVKILQMIGAGAVGRASATTRNDQINIPLRALH